MNNTHLKIVSFAGLFAASNTALAHTGALPADGALDGFLHPFLGPDHLMVMLGVGLWCATQTAHAAGRIVSLFLLYMLGGALLGLHGIQFAYVEIAILLSLLAIGGLLALGKLQLPMAICGALVAASAAMHGLAHGSEIPETASPHAYLLGMVVATGVLHLSGWGLGIALNRLHASILLKGYGYATGVFGVWLLSAGV